MVFKTLAHDHYRLHAPTITPLLDRNLTEPRAIMPTVVIPREQFKRWANDYKILAEFSAEVLGNRDFTLFDIMHWYEKKAAHIEKRGRKLWEDYQP